MTGPGEISIGPGEPDTLIDTADLDFCAQEPIHSPGSIQPHGLMLVADAATLHVSHVAGDVEGRLGWKDWNGARLETLVGVRLAGQAALLNAAGRRGVLGDLTTRDGVRMDVSAYRSGSRLILELERASTAMTPMASVLGSLEEAARSFERAGSLSAMCDRAAIAFRELTGFDRVMVYRFLDDDAGRVVAEDCRDDMGGFFNHHFPASDIPRQARALYVRNLTRVIPDVAYEPAPLRPVWLEAEPLDLSDSSVRSVSPIHVQYLANMGVAASASISIVTDGVLWGLIACHNETPRGLSYDVRAACRTLAGDLSRQIKANEAADVYRERLRVTTVGDRITELLSREGSLDEALQHQANDIRSMLGGDGVALIRAGEVVIAGVCPHETEVRDLGQWILARSTDPVFCTDRLAEIYPPAESFAFEASGCLGIVLSPDEPWVLLWFRAEQVEVVSWAGNPHKPREASEKEILTPRASFAAWRETVRGRSRRWTLPEVEAAGRLRAVVLEISRRRRTEDLNRRLTDTLKDKNRLIQQNEFLVGEMNHRVQNSLQLVSSFLSLQARDSADAALKAALEEARRRLVAVGLVHRRLYRSDQFQQVDAARYIEELCDDLSQSMGVPWAGKVVLDLEPLTIPTDRVVTLGLVLTELLINAQKYAYGGAPGSIVIKLTQDRTAFRLTVSDFGVGNVSGHKGFGSRMMEAMVAQLGGELMLSDNAPGLRATLAAPIEAGQ